MPTIGNISFYKAFFTSAQKFFKDPAKRPSYQSYETVLRDASPVYRYVGYRDSIPQPDKAARTIWLPLQKDINNRWTGASATDGMPGAQGLYLSGESPGGADTSFAELVHYQDSSLPPDTKVSYFNYEAGKSPVWTSAMASELRSMFLFTTKGDMKGVNLSYTEDPESPINQIYSLSVEENRELLGSTNVKALYFSPSDADFCRAVGNAAFLSGGYQYIETSSVRDPSNARNIIVYGQSGVTIESLEPQGRATFLIDGMTRTSKGVFTIDDLQYNAIYDATGLGEIPSSKQLEPDFAPFEQAAIEISKFVSPTYMQHEVPGFISTNTQDRLMKIDDPYSMSVDQLVEALATPGLAASVRGFLTEYTLECASQWSGYVDLVKTLGAEGVASLLNVQIVDPVFAEMTDSTDGPSYIDLSVRQTVLTEQSHYLAQNASAIQTELARANTAATETSSEIAAQTAALDKVNAELAKDPTNPSLLDQQGELERELKALDAVEKKAEEDKQEADSNLQQNEDKTEANEADSDATNEALDTASKEIFHGE